MSKIRFSPSWQTTAVTLDSYRSIFSGSTHHPGLAVIAKKRKFLRPKTIGAYTKSLGTGPELMQIPDRPHKKSVKRLINTKSSA